MKNNSWPEVSLGDYTDFLTGFPFKSAKYVNDSNGIRLLRGDNIVQGALRWENCKKWTSEEIEQFSKYSLEYNDIVLAMDRPWIEAGLKWAYIKESDLPCLLVQRVSRLRGKNGLLTNFIRYIISDINFTNYVKSVITGINIPHISGPQIQAYQFRLPPIKTQQKIASILSNYDDLIENNTRRIEILEQMAKLVYEEWFIKFRFPGHENVKMVSSELGEIPEGWKIRSIEEITTLIKRGVSPKYEESSNEIVINQKCIRNFRLSLEESRRHISKVPPEKNLIKGDVLINSTGVGTLGRVTQVLEDLPNCTVDSHVTIVRPERDLDLNFFGLQIFRLQNYFESQGRGATGQAELGRDTIQETKVIIAPKEIQDHFSNRIDSLRNLAMKLDKKNQNLRKTRDLLLPKLISGEIDVSDLDIRIKNEYQENNFSFGEPQDEKGLRVKMV